MRNHRELIQEMQANSVVAACLRCEAKGHETWTWKSICENKTGPTWSDMSQSLSKRPKLQVVFFLHVSFSLLFFVSGVNYFFVSHHMKRRWARSHWDCDQQFHRSPGEEGQAPQGARTSGPPAKKQKLQGLAESPVSEFLLSATFFLGATRKPFCRDFG